MSGDEKRGPWDSDDSSPDIALSRSSSCSIREHGPQDVKAQDGLRAAQVLELARKFTTESHASQQNPFYAPIGGALDPTSPSFRAKSWARAFFNSVNQSTPSKVVGVAFKDLHVFGHGSPTDFRSTVGNSILKIPSLVGRAFGARQHRIDILHSVEGLVRPGEMLCVLGPPGSGCSTLLKTVAGDTYGLNVSEQSLINYEGITPKQMHSMYKGEAIYTAEVDAHFPNLNVSDTLYVAAMARTPYSLPQGVSRTRYAEHLRDVVMALFGISHTYNTKVGNDFVRGVSGGERKRITIAEATLSNAPLQCWDNSTRGLDSANAIEFCKTLRIQSEVFGAASCVAIYQAPQAAYEVSWSQRHGIFLLTNF
jgi:ATP-binding cassette, subfamily G (WHITE), member 2, PDR